MNSLLFVKKELAELRHCKKVLLLLGVALIYPLFLNLLADKPVVPLGLALKLSAFLSVCLSAEVVFMLMVDEIKKGTFDILILSKCRIGKALLVKVSIAALLGVLATMGGFLINNCGSIFIEKVIAIEAITLYDLIQFMMASVICAMSALYLMLRFRKYDNTYLTGNILVVAVGFIVLYVVSGYINKGIILIAEVAVAFLLYYGMIRRLKEESVKKEAKCTTKSVFSERDNTWFKVIQKREWKRILVRKSVAVKLGILFFIFLFSNQKIEGYGEMLRGLILALELFSLQLVFIMDFYFNSAKQEIYEKMEDILKMVGISKSKNLLLSLGIYVMLGTISGLLIFLILNIVSKVGTGFAWFGLKEILLYLIQLLFCGMACFIMLSKGLKSMREERIVKIFSYGVCFLISLVMVWVFLY